MGLAKLYPFLAIGIRFFFLSPLYLREGVTGGPGGTNSFLGQIYFEYHKNGKIRKYKMGKGWEDRL